MSRTNIEMLRKNLIKCFMKPLPGLESHLKMALPERRKDILDVQKQKSAIKSSVLLLFYEGQDDVYLVFIRRPAYSGVHSGQIAFPGGRWESTDKSLYHTALREAREETGIFPERVQFVGKLTDLYIPPSNYIVFPYVAIYNGNCVFEPNIREVEEILEIPVGFLFGKESRFEITEVSLPDGTIIQSPGLDYKGNIIWGATAMILNELLIQWKTTVNNRCFNL